MDTRTVTIETVARACDRSSDGERRRPYVFEYRSGLQAKAYGRLGR